MAQKGESMIPTGYTLVRPINEGAFGRVLEIKELSTGQSYALKLIPRLTEADQKRAEREASLLERFRHARIVGLHESVVMETYHGIVMDLGVRNLKDLMTDFESRNELIPLEVAVMICIDIAEGLSVMHNHPTNAMAHGDLKPENVLLSEDNRAMLCDLGAADASGVNATRSASEMGTYEYNSPERLDDEKTKGTPASDIWSLGVMLHRMVTGKPLFGGGSLSKIVQAIMDFDESKLPTSIPEDIRAVLVKMLEPNPASRVTATQLFNGRQLERMLGPETPLTKMKDLLIQSASSQSGTVAPEAPVVDEKALAELKQKNEALQKENAEIEKQIAILQKQKKDTAALGEGGSNTVEDVGRLASFERNDLLLKNTHMTEIMPSCWMGSESIRTLDPSSHALTSTTLSQIVPLTGKNAWRTVLTFPITEGKWELRLRALPDTFENVTVGYLRYPFTVSETSKRSSEWENGFGGDFILADGSMRKGGKEYKPAGTNKTCTKQGQIVCLHLNLSRNEAKLDIDEKRQPGIFTHIPSQVCLTISTTGEKKSFEIVWLRQLRSDPTQFQIEQSQATLNCWVGTESLKTFDPTSHLLTLSTITQIGGFVPGQPKFRNIWTHPINSGRWELSIRGSQNNLGDVMLSYLRHPLPEKAMSEQPGIFFSGIGGQFSLSNGKMWKGGKETNGEGTNKTCLEIGQTAAIRVDMDRGRAWLYIDDRKQPGMFTDVPSPLCLGITTAFTEPHMFVEVLWLKKLK
ncbi:putative Cyclin-dependent kinase 2 [Blattamonas nauphoetae]|uniref:non-specific serine/threonine protein kinase n=1 Tax=Blattamonas nauphoetae TaxID=2049346 RepID=A0ABQ9X783_9EUKA|nr:putative Cyclin-dependent kinase 2 [Blattamonas nauphoetae]